MDGPAMSSSEGKRFCPVCGEETKAAFCPNDRTPTVLAMGFAKHPRAYEIDDIVAARYRITGALGAGGFAAVYAAEHMGTAQEVAVKLMAFDMTAPESDVAVRRFFREARITAALNHPNTVRVFDVGQDEQGPLFIAMELLRGESMEALLKRRFAEGRGLTEAETLDIAIPVLSSLAEAHATGLVHRDLKPANIFLTEAPDGSTVVKVLDFGIARTADSSLTLGGNMPGTPPFMSPEQCRGEKLDGRSDLYSLAVLIFLCVCEQLPFADANILKLMRMHSFEEPPDPRQVARAPVSDELATVILRTLAKRPTDRPTSADEMKRLLDLIRDGSFALGGMTIVPLAAPKPAGLSTVDLLDMPTRDSQMIPAPRIDPATIDIDFGDDDDEPVAEHTRPAPPPHEIRGKAPAPAPADIEVRSSTPLKSEPAAVAPEPVAPSPAPAAGEEPETPAATPAPAPPTAIAAPAKADTSGGKGLWVGLGVLVLGGIVAAVALGGGGGDSDRAPVKPTAVPAAVKQAEDKARATRRAAAATADKAMAQEYAAKAISEEDFGLRLKFARKARELDPKNPRYAKLIESIQDDMQKALAAKNAAPAPSADAGAPEPAPAAKPTPTRKATARPTTRPARKKAKLAPAIVPE